MTRTMLAIAASLLAGTALAQPTPGNTAPGATSNAPMPGVSSSTGVTPGTGVVNRNTGIAAASGDRNQAVTTTNANAPQPARGANSFSQGEAQRRIGSAGYQNVGALTKDEGGVWRGAAAKDGRSVNVWLDYKGNVGQDSGMAQTTSAPGNGPGSVPGNTMGSRPGTATSRPLDRPLGADATGVGPTGSRALAPR